jgi:hypothetical protein
MLKKLVLVFKCCSGTHLPTYLQLLGPRACVWEWRGASGRRGKTRARVGRGMHGKRSSVGPHMRHISVRAGVQTSAVGASVRTQVPRSDVRALILLVTYTFLEYY